MSGPAATSSAAREDRDRGAYLPRRPEQTVLYRVVADSLETFLARAREQGRRVPRFVEREFRRFLDCGIPAHGFLRVRCDACGCERLVPFSCKGRGFCPSCAGRRMADTAAHLVDRVFPVVAVRQWVLTLPWALRYRMAYDACLTSDLLRVFTRAVFASLRRRAKRCGDRRKLRCGAVTFIQRFGDALNLNVHFHTLALDGVYGDGDEGEMRFNPLPAPDDAEVARVAARVARGVARVLERRGLRRDADPGEVDPLGRDEPLLAALCAASVRGRIATGRRAGQAVLRFGDRIDADAVEDAPPGSPRCASVAGVSVHADVAVPARDRDRLERLCRYVARPPLAGERLEQLSDGRLLYALKRRWRDGTTHVLFESLELIEKLAALVPPPRANTVRYHGVLAPAARRRSAVVPLEAASCESTSDPGCTAGANGDGTRSVPTDVSGTPNGTASQPRSRTSCGNRTRLRGYSWPELMQRVFAIDVLECPDCGAAMRILAAIHPPDATQAILDCLGLPSRPPPLTRACPDPDLEVFPEFDDTDPAHWS